VGVEGAGETGRGGGAEGGEMRISKDRAAADIQAELDDAKRMLDKIQFDPRRDLEKANEKLHYWDGKVTGLALALQFVRNIA
jgi:hypothetical protein